MHPTTAVRQSVHVLGCLAVAWTASLGCGPAASIGDATTPGSDPASASKAPAPTDGCANAHVAYADVQPIFDHYCTRCHATTLSASSRGGAPLGVNYDTYASAAAEAEYAVSAVRANMPPGLRLSSVDICTLTMWASEGAPE